jgi:GNAT superfamily N-acetyltransferase
VKIENNNFTETTSKQIFIDFLYHHLGEYGDKKEDIKRAIDYAFSDEKGKGGFVLIAFEEDVLVGGVVINDTGMTGYIPDHILVYIATHKEFRGKGIGTSLLKKIFKECQGDIALHVEYENPAVRLYKRVGFSSKYAEMRYKNLEG